MLPHAPCHIKVSACGSCSLPNVHELTNDLDVLLDRNHPYGKYEERLSLFWANRKSSSQSLRQELKDEQDPKKFARLELDRLRNK